MPLCARYFPATTAKLLEIDNYANYAVRLLMHGSSGRSSPEEERRSRLHETLQFRELCVAFEMLFAIRMLKKYSVGATEFTIWDQTKTRIEKVPSVIRKNAVYRLYEVLLGKQIDCKVISHHSLRKIIL